MMSLEQISPPHELVESGFASLLESHGKAFGACLQIWSRHTSPILSGPDRIEGEVLNRARALVRRVNRQDTCLWEGHPAGPMLAVPVRCRGDVVGAVTATPLGLSAPAVEISSATTGTAVLAPPLTAGKLDQRLLTNEYLQTSLGALAQALGRHLELILHLADQTTELTSLRREHRLLHRISTRLGDPGESRRTIEFILQQGCSLASSDMAILQLPEARVPLVCRSPVLTTRRLPIARSTLRQMAGQLWWRMRSLPSTRIQGSLKEILGGHSPVPNPVQIAMSRLSPESPKAGFLAFLRSGRTGFQRDELRLIDTLAEQTSIALKSADLHENAGNFLMSTVKALVSAIETKDRYTSGHSARVNLIAMLLGKQLELPPDELEALRWASILHDVGKIGMPESILHKPGRLSAEEFEVVKKHPWRGYEVLSHIGQLKAASQAVLFHHERMDGRGYPLGIGGKAIPRAARIIAVADAFDALTSTRPYREARHVDSAHAEIVRARDTQFDGDVVDALGQMIPFLREHQVMLETADRPA